MSATPLNELLNKEVDRKEFLIYTGLILLTITGIPGVMKNVLNVINGKQQKDFGSGPYGK